MNNLVGYKRFLTIINVIVLTLVVFMFHLGVFSFISPVLFFIISMIVFGLCFYSPMIGFALFIGLLPLEIVDIAPDALGLGLRPYQIFGIATLSGIVMSMIFQKSKRRMFVWTGLDSLMTLFILIGVSSGVVNYSVGYTVKATIVMISFGVLYYVVRLFIHTKKDIIALLPIFISSGVIIALYAIVQNILFSLDYVHREIMPGRPNATFAEADWLGAYLVFVFAVCVAYLYYHAHFRHLWKLFDIALYFSMWIITTALIITVARSAWLGATAVSVGYMILVVLQKKYKFAAKHAIWFSSIFLLSLITVFTFSLTTFELGNRAQSTSSGLQEITVSCSDPVQRDKLIAREMIAHVDELQSYNCRHIDLEEIAQEEVQGNYVFKIYRKDPNVVARAEVFGKSITAIKQRPILGYGWGSSGAILGHDEAGTPFNASNIFLEVAISTGLLGVSVFVGIALYITALSLRILFTRKGKMQKSIALLTLVGIVAIGVPNLFNAGIFLGFVWAFLGLVAILRKML